MLALFLATNVRTATTYYVSPTGGGDCSIGSPCTIATAISAVVAGDIINANNGTYRGSGSMLAAIGKNGTSGAHITFQAINDGGVVIDGQGASNPLNLNNSDYWDISGIDVANSSGSGAVIQNGSDHNTFRRVIAYNACATCNSHIWSIDSSDSNVFEDIAGFGTGRTVVTNFQSASNVFRRMFGEWNSTQRSEVKLTAQLNYDSVHTTVENSIFTWKPLPGTNTTEMNDILASGPDSSMDRDIFFNLYGNIAYTMPGTTFGTPEYYIGTPRTNEVHFKDTVAFVPSSETTAKPAWWGNCQTSDSSNVDCMSSNNSAENSTLIGGQASDIGDMWTLTNVVQAGSIAAAYGNQSLYTSTVGAKICNRYVNGTLGSTPLWPWPMNQRIINAMQRAGYSPRNVNTDIQTLFGPFPASCTPSSGDTTPPVTTITSPTSGATVQGTITVTANATDNVAVAGVNFYVNGVFQSADATSPYSFSLNTTNYNDGTIALTVTATDTSNNTATSPQVLVNVRNTVTDTTPPTVNITSPTDGTTVTGTVNVTANATDNVGVATVQMFANGISIGTKTSSPYTIAWNTTGASNGQATLRATATDAASNTTTSPQVLVFVNNVSDSIPPTTAITSPTAGSTIRRGTRLTVTATASDNIGVSSVKFYQNGSLKCTDTAPPYSCSINIPGSKGKQYTFQTLATDTSMNTAYSIPVTVTSSQ